MIITTQINDTSSPALRQLVLDVRNAQAIARAGGRGVANLLRDHFARLEESNPNRRGYARTHFWSKVRGTVNEPVEVNPNTVSVNITSTEIAQKVFGGEIKPKPGHKYLTLPAHPDAYGRRAREFPGLHFGFAVNDGGFLAPALLGQRGVVTNIEQSTRGKKKFKATSTEIGETPLFWLVKRVRQTPMPGALPTEAALTRSATLGAEDWAANLTARANTAAAQKNNGPDPSPPAPGN